MTTLSPHLLLTRAIFGLAPQRSGDFSRASRSLLHARELLTRAANGRAPHSTLILLTGPSGSGKSSLLRALRTECAARHPLPILNLSQRTACRAAPCLIDELAQATGLPWQRIALTLSRVGLAQPALWTRPIVTLSDGERSRARLALHALCAWCARPDPVILVDEFLSVLDRPTAHSVCAGVARLLSDHPGTLLIAATTHTDLLPALAAYSTQRVQLEGVTATMATINPAPAHGQ